MARKPRNASNDAENASEVERANALQEQDRATAEEATRQAEEANRLPTNSAIANPAPASAADMEASGAFIEREIREAVDVEHPSVDNNPRSGTSGVQNGVDWNDPFRQTPDSPDFVGQGLDPVPYGDAAKK